MSTLKEIRSETAAALESIEGLAVYQYVPPTVSGTSAVIQPGTPFLTDDGQPYGSYLTNWLVSLIIQTGTNERVTEELDVLILSALKMLDVSEVSQPFEFSDHGSTYLAANLSVSTTITIEE